MKGHVIDIAKKRISDFILSESGRVSSRNTLAVSAIVSTSALAAMLLAPNPAEANGPNCFGFGMALTCPPGTICCSDADEVCCVVTEGGCPTFC